MAVVDPSIDAKLEAKLLELNAAGTQLLAIRRNAKKKRAEAFFLRERLANEYWSLFERAVREGYARTAPNRDLLLKDRAHQAVDYLEFVCTHFTASIAAARKLEIAQDLFPFPPTSSTFFCAQQLVTRFQPDKVPSLRARFEPIGLPTSGFDAELDDSPADHGMLEGQPLQIIRNEFHGPVGQVQVGNNNRQAAGAQDSSKSTLSPTILGDGNTITITQNKEQSKAADEPTSWGIVGKIAELLAGLVSIWKIGMDWFKGGNSSSGPGG